MHRHREADPNLPEVLHPEAARSPRHPAVRIRHRPAVHPNHPEAVRPGVACQEVIPIRHQLHVAFLVRDPTFASV